MQYERALTAFEEAKALGVPMDTRAYNIALRACHTPGKTMRQEQLLQAFALYDELKQRGLPPDTFTFGTLFALCAAARQGHCAMQASGAAAGCARTFGRAPRASGLKPGQRHGPLHTASRLDSATPARPSPLPTPTPAPLSFPQLYDEMMELKVQENVVAMTALIKAVGCTPGMAAECSRLFKRMSYGPARWGALGSGTPAAALPGWLAGWLTPAIPGPGALQGEAQPGHIPHRDRGAARAGGAGGGAARVPGHAPPVPRRQQRV